MAVSEAKKAYRQTPAEKEKRRLYAKEYRQRTKAKKRDAERAARRRAEPGGAEINRARVKANRAALGRNYLTELLADETGMLDRTVVLLEPERTDMSIVIERGPTETPDEQVPTDSLFWVWFDTNCGMGAPDWWWENPGAQPLPAALDLAAELRAGGWIVRVMPDGMNPRPDGRWDNPA